MVIPPPLATSLLLAGAYILGSIPFALLLGLLLGRDIRRLGSGNPGATNLARAAGRAWGIAAFALDFGKGLVPVLLARWLPGAEPERFLLVEKGGLELAAALAAIAGHVWPVWLRFRGGKGVATTFGAMAGLAPLAALVAAIVWAGAYLVTRTVSVASILAALALPAAVFFIERSRSGFLLLLAFTLGITVLILLRHRSNIARLLRGEELRFR